MPLLNGVTTLMENEYNEVEATLEVTKALIDATLEHLRLGNFYTCKRMIGCITSPLALCEHKLDNLAVGDKK